MTLQLVYTLALPLIASLVSYALQQCHFSDKVNTIIASLTIIVAAFIRLLLDGQINEDAIHDITIVMAATTALQAETFIPLQRYLRGSFLSPDKNNNPPTTFRPTVTDWRKEK